MTEEPQPRQPQEPQPQEPQAQPPEPQGPVGQREEPVAQAQEPVVRPEEPVTPLGPPPPQAQAPQAQAPQPQAPQHPQPQGQPPPQPHAQAYQGQLPPRPAGLRGDQAGWLVAAIVVAIVLVVMIAAGAFLIGRATAPRHGPMHPRLRDDIQTSAIAQTSAITQSGLAASTSPIPGVVDLDTVLSNQHEAAGTGIVLSADGLVLTNNHVVAGSTSIRATDVDNGQSYQATVVGYDRSDDLAVVQLSGASGLPVAPLGSSSSVNPGDPVQAIGNAGGQGGQPAVASGTVVALNQPITAQDNTGSTERLTGLIEVNAAIQPGDSGGPLATTNGKVIGIDTAGTDNGPSTRDNATQGFAIPIDRATTIADQITGGQASNTVHIGQSAFVGIQTVGSARGGAPVVAVLPGGPASSTPLAAGDTIQTVDGRSIDSPDALSTVLDQHHPGDHVTIGWTTASGQAMTATVTLGTGPVG